MYLSTSIEFEAIPGPAADPLTAGSAAQNGRPALPNQRMKLTACGRRLRRNAQWKAFILSAAPAGRSLCAIR
jgi:hypothetical protein